MTRLLGVCIALALGGGLLGARLGGAERGRLRAWPVLIAAGTIIMLGAFSAACALARQRVAGG